MSASAVLSFEVYRESYQMASQVARQAERAFQFERDSSEVYIQTDNWQSNRSGLLAGERLLLQLNRMEKAYLETNTRKLEVRQSLSLLQLAPAELQRLQQTGKCRPFYCNTTTSGNQVTFFGLAPDARLADPAVAARVVRWLPVLGHDDKGKVVVHDYKAEDGAPGLADRTIRIATTSSARLERAITSPR